MVKETDAPQSRHRRRGSRTRPGLSLAKQFGDHGFTVGLVARNRDKPGKLTDALAEQGMTARGYSSDGTDPSGLRAAPVATFAELGPLVVGASGGPGRMLYGADPRRQTPDAALLRSVLGPTLAPDESH